MVQRFSVTLASGNCTKLARTTTSKVSPVESEILWSTKDDILKPIHGLDLHDRHDVLRGIKYGQTWITFSLTTYPEDNRSVMTVLIRSVQHSPQVLETVPANLL